MNITRIVMIVVKLVPVLLLVVHAERFQVARVADAPLVHRLELLLRNVTVQVVIHFLHTHKVHRLAIRGHRFECGSVKM